jgi:hypothetical protein
VLSILDTGAFVREFTVDGSDTLQRVIVFASGYIAVLSEAEAGGFIRMYGLNGKKISQYALGDKVVEWCRAEFESAESALGIALKGGSVKVLGAPDLRPLCEVQCNSSVVKMAFSAVMNVFVLATAAGGVLALSFD